MTDQPDLPDYLALIRAADQARTEAAEAVTRILSHGATVYPGDLHERDAAYAAFCALAALTDTAADAALWQALWIEHEAALAVGMRDKGYVLWRAAVDAVEAARGKSD